LLHSLTPSVSRVLTKEAFCDHTLLLSAFLFQHKLSISFSIIPLNSAWFLIDNIFISTHRRISSLSTSTCAELVEVSHLKTVRGTLVGLLPYWLYRFSSPVAHHPASYPDPKCTYTPLENLVCTRIFSESFDPPLCTQVNYSITPLHFKIDRYAVYWLNR